MSDKKVILQSILTQGILPLFYWESPSVCLKVMQTLYRAGVRAIEYTNRGTAALDNFTMLKKTLATEAPDLYLGIGTIKSKAEAEAFVKGRVNEGESAGVEGGQFGIGHFSGETEPGLGRNLRSVGATAARQYQVNRMGAAHLAPG